MSTEIRWQSGKEEYNREEIEYMLSSQRAMIHNDIVSICANYQKNRIDKMSNDSLSTEGIAIVNYLKSPRTVEI